MSFKPHVRLHGRKIAIVTPVFNDWAALTGVVEQIADLPDLAGHSIDLIVVDDGSPEKEHSIDWRRHAAIRSVQVVRLACNLGHQRAIAVGLVEALKIPDLDAVVVMDSDGEDVPGDIPKLLAAWRENPESIIVAKRGQRREGFAFRAFYIAYKTIFRVLTGQVINFGNFSLLPIHAVRALVHNSAIWNNLAAAISRSRIPYVRLQLDRGSRLAGQSRMNFVSLALHGVSAVSVYAEVVLVRMTALAFLLGGFAMAGGLGVLAIKLGTNWAIPGWASYVTAALVVIFLQAVLLGTMSMFQLLSTRTLKPFIPARDAGAFVLDAAYESLPVAAE
ncbi:MAG: glycosyltransferase [Hyphomicrobiales bacterium]|nr:glycosyltransferase [Rhodoblastus sp.]MCB9998281.1 glycosyltransferase [Methylobacteriaceae bacterium]MCC2104864.1 glycosyltransferase [Hyphomicrobiales bacterium]HRY02322.1 glycosyltransferase [Beijerinckiaceae bacterium]MCB1525365.1 glycosyltransferase [Rhodoblastus sp.]